MPESRLMSSVLRAGAMRAGGGEAGTEKPMMEDVGSLEEEGEEPSVGLRREAQDFLGAGTGAGAGTGTGLEVEASGVECASVSVSVGGGTVEGPGADVDGASGSDETGG